MEHEVAAGGERGARALARASPTSAPIETSSLISSPSKSDRSRESLRRSLSAEVVAGATGSMAVNTTCAVIPSGRSRQRPEGGEIGRFERRAVGIDDRQRARGCRHWRGRGPGMCLSTGSTPPVHQALGHRRARSPRPFRRVAIGAVADHGIGAARPAHRRAAGSRRRCRARARSAAISRAPSRAAASPAAGSRS